MSYWREADQGGGLLDGDPTELRHFGDQHCAGYRADSRNGSQDSCGFGQGCIQAGDVSTDRIAEAGRREARARGLSGIALAESIGQFSTAARSRRHKRSRIALEDRESRNDAPP